MIVHKNCTNLELKSITASKPFLAVAQYRIFLIKYPGSVRRSVPYVLLKTVGTDYDGSLISRLNVSAKGQPDRW